MAEGRDQRRALSAAERVIAALERGDAGAARRAAGDAARLDAIGIFSGLAGAVEEVAGRLEAGGEVDDEGWDRIAAAVGPGPLAARARANR